MLGKLNLKEHRVSIVGAGFAGLVAAYFLDQKGYEVELLEISDRAGGLIATQNTRYGIAESAAHSFLATQPVLALLQDLNVEWSGIQDSSRARYVLRGGKLRRFPLGIFETAEMIWRSAFVMGRSEGSESESSVSSWGERHLGKSAVNYLLSPMIQGVFASSPSEIVLDAAFPDWRVSSGRSLLGELVLKKISQMKKKTPSAVRPRMIAPSFGMQSLTDALTFRLKTRLGSRFRMNTEISKLPSFKNVILTVPAHVASSFVADRSPSLSALLSAVTYVPLTSVTVFARKDQFEKSPNGVGVLIPKSENRSCLGILFNSSSFPNRVSESDWISCTALLGGSKNHLAITQSDSVILEQIRQDFTQIFGMKGKFLGYSIHRWPNAIPQYNQQLQALWQQARQELDQDPRLVLFSNYTGQVSLRGMIETFSRMDSEIKI